MSVTYGFYDSVNHDRKYNALQMSSIFDGVINDGIFMSVGSRFNVTANGVNMTVTVGTGRAWFNHTWTLNDAPIPIELPQSEIVMNRYDAIVLEVNSDQSVRANSIKLIKGTPGTNPTYPSLTNTALVHQYPLAYIYVKSGVTSIRQADVTSMIGKSSTPYVTGIIDTINIDSMVARWEDEWDKWTSQEKTDFMNWFNNLEDVLDADVAAKLLFRIEVLEGLIGGAHIIYGGVRNGAVEGKLKDYDVNPSMNLTTFIGKIPADQAPCLLIVSFDSTSSTLNSGMPIQTGGVLVGYSMYPASGAPAIMSMPLMFLDYRTGDIYSTTYAFGTPTIAWKGVLTTDGGNVKGKLRLKSGSIVSNINGGDSSNAAHLRIARFTITGSYANDVIVMELAHRGTHLSTTLYISFFGSADLNPLVDRFYYTGQYVEFLLHREVSNANGGVWDLTVDKNAWDEFDILRLHVPDYLDNRIRIDLMNDFVGVISSTNLYKPTLGGDAYAAQYLIDYVDHESIIGASPVVSDQFTSFAIWSGQNIRSITDNMAKLALGFGVETDLIEWMLGRFTLYQNLLTAVGPIVMITFSIEATNDVSYGGIVGTIPAKYTPTMEVKYWYPLENFENREQWQYLEFQPSGNIKIWNREAVPLKTGSRINGSAIWIRDF